jgi:integrase
VTRIRKYVHHFVDDRFGKAKGRYYFRRRGFKQVPLPGLPGSLEFEQAYQAAMIDRPLAIGAKRIRVGSLGALVIAYCNSPKFLTLAPSTRSTYRNILERFTKEHGDKPLALLTRQHINAMLARKVETPAAANHWLRLVKTLMHFAVAEGMRADDPSTGVEFLEHHTLGFHTWGEDEIATYREHHALGTKARLALELLLNMATRRSDVVKLGRQHVRDGVLRFRAKKTSRSTGMEVIIPVLPELQQALDAAPKSDHLTFLVTAYSKTFTANGFGGWFRDRCDEAGLPQCSAHGLRKACSRRLAEAGCSANVIAAVIGDTTLREVERYTKAADRKLMAQLGMDALKSRTVIAGTGSGNGQ